MKKIVLGVLGIMLLLGAGKELTNKIQAPHFAKASRGKPNSNSNQSLNQNVNKITQSSSPTGHYSLVTRHSIFIPYWSSSLTEEDMKYDTYYYFGIAPTAKGEIEDDVGLSNMPKIVESLKLKAKSQKKLVLRMLNTSVNDVLLTDREAQKTLSAEVSAILEQNTISGIVLDIEVPFTLQAEKKGQITQFVQQICTSIKSYYKTCDVLVYGDFSYRGRPYDLRALGAAADNIILMAYDFHKAGGEPGPNFTFNEREKYGYDFKQMVADATALVPKERIEVVFGMYGYDWTLNEQGKPLKSATALSLNQIQALNSNSKKTYSNAAKEKSIQYIDDSGRNHIVWYEDEESAAVKIKHLQSVGIGKVSYWAQGYF